MGKRGVRVLLACCAALPGILPVAAAAGDGTRDVSPSQQDKDRYTLFSPTPRALMREMTTDRPDTTESPFTIDAGHVQIESQLFGYARSRADAEGAVTEAWEYASTNMRVGITNDFELGLVVQPYGVVRTRTLAPAQSTRSSGPGAVELRAKLNLWGNDAFERTGATALALLPYVSLPTDADNGVSPEDVEGGLIVPVAVKLSDKFGLGMMGEVDIVRDDEGSGYHAEYLASASLSYEWNSRLGTYYEIAARFGTEDPRGDAVVLGTGFTYELRQDVQLDAGVNFGVTRAADRINPFIGLSMRF